MKEIIALLFHPAFIKSGKQTSHGLPVLYFFLIIDFSFFYDLHPALFYFNHRDRTVGRHASRPEIPGIHPVLDTV